MKMNSNFYKRAMKKQSSNIMRFLAVMLTSAFLFSCDQMNDVDEVVDDLKEKQEARFFKANLSPLNNSGVTGEATFTYMEDGKFEAHINAKNLVPSMVHPQHIHGFGFEDKNPENAVCPPMSAAGDDGLLSLEDGQPFYGRILVPLDNNLVPLSADEFPMANSNGQQNYLQYTKLNTLVHAINMAYNGEQTRKNISLTKRVVVLHGAYVKDNKIVEEGTEGAEYVATLPVACGEIEEVY
jgi:hypothetical protein